MSLAGPNSPAPYAPPAALVSLINQHREGKLPRPITSASLGRVGITESLIPRTLQALKILGLIDDNGKPTDEFEAFRLAKSSDFPKRLEAWLKAAYAPVFQVIDPASAEPQQVRDAFRGFEPSGQQQRMVTLFLGLCAHAGLVPPESVNARSPRVFIKPKPKKSSSRKKQVSVAGSAYIANPKVGKGLPPLLLGFMDSLPRDGDPLTEKRLEEILDALPAILRFAYPMKEATTSENDQEELK